MAIIRAVKSGNWSDPTVWAPSVPTAADDVYSNTFTVTIDVSLTVLSLQNGATTGVTAGGGFTVSANDITITCTAANGIVNGVNANNISVLTVSNGAGTSVTVNTNAFAATGSNTPSNSHGVNFNGAGTLVFNGNATGGGNPSVLSYGLINSGSGTINMSGNAIGNSGNTGVGVVNAAGGIINITGNATGGALAGLGLGYGAANMSSGIMTVVGNATGAAGNNGSHGVHNSGTGTLNLIGTATGTATNFNNLTAGASNSGTGTLNISGDVFGSTGSNTVGAVNSGTGTLNITGNITPSTSNGALNNGSGTLNHVGIVYGGPSNAGIGVGSPTQITILTGPLISIEGTAGAAAASGVNPCIALRWFPADTALGTFEYRMRGATVGGSPLTRPARRLFLTNAYDSGYPATGNVRSQTTYGPGGIYAGTLAVPPAGSVALGVPVDNTTGTAVLTQANFQAALTAQGLTTTRAGYLDNLSAAPPTAAAIATAVNSALDRTGFSLTSAERDAISVAVQAGILNENDGQQILNAIVGAIGNQNIDQLALVAAIRADLERTGGTLATRLAASAYQAPPTAAANASAVRAELAPELNRMDEPISSRLAASAYTAPPSAATIAAAVWSASTRTLTTAIDNSSTIAAAVWAYVTRTITGGTVTTLTNAPDVPTEAEIADAVRVELTPELERLANAATTQEVGDIVEGAMRLPEDP